MSDVFGCCLLNCEGMLGMRQTAVSIMARAKTTQLSVHTQVEVFLVNAADEEPLPAKLD